MGCVSVIFFKCTKMDLLDFVQECYGRAADDDVLNALVV